VTGNIRLTAREKVALLLLHHCSAGNQLHENKQSISGVNLHCTNGSEARQQYEFNMPVLQPLKLSRHLLFHTTVTNVGTAATRYKNQQAFE
jgi:hypothetical protein